MQEANAQGFVVQLEGAEFERRVTSIGHLLAMMAPWDHPVFVTRVRAFKIDTYHMLRTRWQLTTHYPFWQPSR